MVVIGALVFASRCLSNSSLVIISSCTKQYHVQFIARDNLSRRRSFQQGNVLVRAVKEVRRRNQLKTIYLF